MTIYAKHNISVEEDRFHFKGNKIGAIFELNCFYSNWIEVVGIEISHLIFHSLRGIFSIELLYLIKFYNCRSD